MNGGSRYAVIFVAGQLPPVNGFWSLTVYNKEHLFEPNKLNRFSLGTKSKSMKPDSDGSDDPSLSEPVAGCGPRDKLGTDAERRVLTLHSGLLAKGGDT